MCDRFRLSLLQNVLPPNLMLLHPYSLETRSWTLLSLCVMGESQLSSQGFLGNQKSGKTCSWLTSGVEWCNRTTYALVEQNWVWISSTTLAPFLLILKFIHCPDSSLDILHSHKAFVQAQIVSNSILWIEEGQWWLNSHSSSQSLHSGWLPKYLTFPMLSTGRYPNILFTVWS